MKYSTSRRQLPSKISNRKKISNEDFKVVSATFLLLCFSSPKKSNCETWKNVFYFSSKALFVLGKVTFLYFRYSDFMTSSNATALDQ